MTNLFILVTIITIADFLRVKESRSRWQIVVNFLGLTAIFSVRYHGVAADWWTESGGAIFMVVAGTVQLLLCLYLRRLDNRGLSEPKNK